MFYRLALLPLMLGLLIGSARAEPFQPVVPMCGQPPAPCTATNSFPTKSSAVPSTLTALGYQQIVSPVAATGLTVPAGATLAVIEVDVTAGHSIRWRDDGTAPTATVGMELQPGSQMTYAGPLAAFQAIQTAVNATINISYYK